MPDRVKVPKSIPSQYRSTYKRVCELQNPASIARSAVRSIKKDVNKFGAGGIELISQASAYLDPLQKNSLIKRMPGCWDDAHEKVNLIAGEVNGNRKFIALAQDACLQVANRLEQGRRMEDIKFEMDKQYHINIWISRFAERVPLQHEHYTGVDDETVREHISIVTSCVEQEVENMLLGIQPEPVDDLLEIDIMQDEL